MNAELIRRFETLLFTIILSKYKSAFCFYPIDVLEAIALYTSDRWLSICGVSILATIASEGHAANVSSFSLYVTSTCFSISLFPIIGFTAVSELCMIN
jgi:hypothetical protein